MDDISVIIQFFALAVGHLSVECVLWVRCLRCFCPFIFVSFGVNSVLAYNFTYLRAFNSRCLIKHRNVFDLTT